MADVLKEAAQIATHELRSCYKEDGIVAGLHHFTDYWARDGYFASFGSLAIGDYTIIKKMVNLFFKYQRTDGLIPYRIMCGPVTLNKYLGHPKFYPNIHPTYRLRGVGQEVLDGTTLTVLFTAILGAKKILKLTEYAPGIKKALSYLESKEKNGLLCDGFMAEWNDSVWKSGNLLYSNVIYWYLFNRLASCTKTIDKSWHSLLKHKENAVRASIYNVLWNGKFFADWHDYKSQNYFNPFGNCLAVTWGLTTEKESDTILEECNKIRVNFTLETNCPKYPWWRVDLLNRLVGMADYQNKGALWWQPLLSYLAALKVTGHISEFNRLVTTVADKVLADNGTFECYERDGKPVTRLLYKSEHPFAWSSGMLLWVLS